MEAPRIAKQNLKAVLLVGGLGSRLRSLVPSSPKPLATLGDKPFLELLVRQLRYQGIRRLVLCTGYLAEQIEHQFGDGGSLDVEIEYSRESQPMGTAGALKLAEDRLKDCPEFLVMNGDSFMQVNFDRLIAFHGAHRGIASLVVRRVENAQRYGSVDLDAEGRVLKFGEKAAGNAPGPINAGVYFFSREVLRHIPSGPCSLETVVFPQLLGRGVFALEQDGMFIDIGVPEDYVRAQAICDRLREAAFENESLERWAE